MALIFNRIFCMPNSNTFEQPPIARFIEKYWAPGIVTVDPFARSSRYANGWSNDFNPETSATHHLDAIEFCDKLIYEGVQADVALFDPPYSPRQISECYKIVGRKVGMTETQNARLYKEVRDRLTQVVRPGGHALSFGWNSMGFGVNRGFEVVEILLVTHGAAHNDTICVAEVKR